MTDAPGPRRIGRRESIYLDLMRALAAFAVVLDHAPEVFRMPYLPRWGHHAVIVFFVLSGYVISNTADVRERGPRAFLVARFARLWSVLLPALALTVLCDAAGRHFGPYAGLYRHVPADWPLVRLGAAASFLGESWVSIQPLSNGVVWSLCCEFWYYALFTAWSFAPPGRRRVLAVGLATLFAGHKALLLLPIWLMGVALQRARGLRRLPASASVALWAAGLAGFAWVLASRIYDPLFDFALWSEGTWLYTQLAQARLFWFDWVVGLLVAAHLLGAGVVAEWLPLERIGRPVRWAAGISFAAYLFHMPLLTLCAAFLAPGQGWLAIGLTLAAIALLGAPVERSKRGWRRLLDRAAGLALAAWPARLAVAQAPAPAATPGRAPNSAA